jgi:7,8-dihydropterin-6-yl-methyl-4-(beta-D-ribofuranosyl)aminobenzene 5'-phosphate synthase
MRRIIVRIIAMLLALVVAAGIVQMVRQTRAAAVVEQSWQTPVSPVRDLGTTTMLTILPLVDEATSRSDLRSEHGVAYLITTDRHTILMDVGMNVANADPAPLLHNMQQLGVNQADIETFAFSHVHPDHVGGLNWWRQDTFALGGQQASLGARPVYAPARLTYPGLSVTVAAQPTVITEAVATTGAIDFVEVFPLSLWRTVRAEQALAVNVEGKGIVLIFGCGHPGLERMVARAQAIFDAPIIGIVGGLHYAGKAADDLRPSIAFVQQLHPQLVAISPHDSSAAAIQSFRDAFPGAYQDVSVGQPIRLSR